jgi:tetratricopeptide (TPR) repeat protein
MEMRDALSLDEQDIAARLANYSRKLQSIRRNDGLVSEGLTSAALENTPAGRRRHARPLSIAENYRFAVQIQRLVQGVSFTQTVLTAVLTAMSSSVLALYIPGYAFGFAASFARVQRQHGLCTVFNLAYLLSSLGCPLALIVALVQAGSATNLINQLPRHSVSSSLIAAGVATGIASVLGSILAAYVIARPLQLYRYESVAGSEEAADQGSERTAGKREGIGIEDPAGHAASAVAPMESWLVAGEPGLLADAHAVGSLVPPPQERKLKPLVFFKVNKQLPPPPSSAAAASSLDGAPGGAAGGTLPVLPKPPSALRSRSSLEPNAADPSAAASGVLTSDELPDRVSGTNYFELASPLPAADAEEAAGGEAAPGSTGKGDRAAGIAAAAAGGMPALVEGAKKAVAGGGEEEEEWGEGEEDDDGEEEEEEEEEEGEEEGGEEEDVAEEGGVVEEEGGAWARMKRLRQGIASAADNARTLTMQASELAVQGQMLTGLSAEELFDRAKQFNKEGKFKKACECIEAAIKLQPKISMALSAANLRLKLGDHHLAIEAYRGVIALKGQDPPVGPTERELEMAERKLVEAIELARQQELHVGALERDAEPQSANWYAAQLDELSQDLFAESATLYAEHGVALQDGLKEMSRHLRAYRILACGQVLPLPPPPRPDPHTRSNPR